MSFSNNRLSGIDVSMYQGDIDWHAVKAAGIQFAFIKATESTSFIDPKFNHNIAAVRTAQIPCGAYHFFRPKKTVQAQIHNFVTTVGQLLPGDLPPVLDVEVPADWSGISVAQRNLMIAEWLEAVHKQLGLNPIIYMSASFAGDVLGGSPTLKNYPLWVAHYTNAPAPSVPKPWRIYSFWQHSDKGTVPGIKGNVDLDYFNGSIQQLTLLRKTQ